MPADRSQETAFSQLMDECFKTNRRLVTAVGQLTNGTGITGTQWGVLGIFGRSDPPITVAEAARRLDLARQGVQRVADLLQEKGLIDYLQNPRHRRAKLAGVTNKGRKLLDKLQARESQWARHAAGDLDVKQVETAAALVRSIRERLLVEPLGG